MLLGVTFVGTKPEFCGAIVRVDIMKVDIDFQENRKIEMITVVITMNCLSTRAFRKRNV